MQSNRRHQLLAFLSGIIMGLIAPTPFIQSAQAQQVFHTQWADIHYEDPASLREMERRLRFSQAQKFSQSYFYTQDPVQAAVSPGLAAKVDGLMVRVSMILGKWPQKTQRLRIFLLKDGKQVQQRRLVLQPFQNAGPSWFGYGRREGFYEPRTRSIFLSLEDLHAGILGHEVAHFVLCESYAPSPASVQEDWARYVEASLD